MVKSRAENPLWDKSNTRSWYNSLFCFLDFALARLVAEFQGTDSSRKVTDLHVLVKDNTGLAAVEASWVRAVAGGDSHAGSKSGDVDKDGGRLVVVLDKLKQLCHCQSPSTVCEVHYSKTV